MSKISWPAVAVLALFVALLYGPMVPDLLWIWWNDDNYSHGFLVIPFSLWLVWQDRDDLAKVPLNGSWAGLPVLLGGVFLLVLGVVGSEDFTMRGSFVVVLAGLILFHAGWPFLKALWFPLGFLFFMVPLPSIVFNAIALPLQSFAAMNATSALFHLGIPAFRDGNVIELTNITLGVTEACSGIRSLISLVGLAVVWAHIAIPGLLLKTVFVALAVPITVLANAGRIVATGLIGQWFGVEYAQGFFHSFSGWIIFLFAALCLMVAHGVLRLFHGRGEATDG